MSRFNLHSIDGREFFLLLLHIIDLGSFPLIVLKLNSLLTTKLLFSLIVFPNCELYLHLEKYMDSHGCLTELENNEGYQK